MRVHKVNVKRTSRPCGLHSCLRHILQLARWTGFFPVQGLGQTCADGTRFKIKCVYSCYYVATLIGQVVMLFFATLFFFQLDVNLTTVSDMIFFGTGLTSAILLFKLAQQWPELTMKATETEKSLTELKLDNETIAKSTMIAYVAMTVALIEHLLCASFNIKFIMNCLEEDGLSSIVMENYVIHVMPYIYNHVPYNGFTAILYKYIVFQTTFLWSFNDVMITCFSVYIIAYFRSLNRIIATNVKKDKDLISWGTLRVHYSNLVKLVKLIDAQISPFILVAFFTDLYYICLQLFNSLHRNHVSFKYCDEEHSKEALRSPFYLLYYLYSFIFLVLRALIMSLFASNVHCAAREPIYHIYDVPSSVYDTEVRRFQLQLQSAEVGLSGKFFNVTRNMIVKVIGTIITYEIVLLQYSVKPKPYYNDDDDNATTIATIVDNVTNV